MSSSDEEAVRRPGRSAGANGPHSPAQNDESGAENKSPFGAGGNQMDEDDDADLFGSDGSEGGLDNIEYGISSELQDAQSTNRFLSNAHHTLDDEQLDSGDDENRYDRREDRMDEAVDEGHFGETVNIMDVGLARAPVPATNDGQVWRRYDCGFGSGLIAFGRSTRCAYPNSCRLSRKSSTLKHTLHLHIPPLPRRCAGARTRTMKLACSRMLV